MPRLLTFDTQITLDQTGLDAAKSSVVFAVTRGVSTPGRAVSAFRRIYAPLLNHNPG